MRGLPFILVISLELEGYNSGGHNGQLYGEIQFFFEDNVMILFYYNFLIT